MGNVIPSAEKNETTKRNDSDTIKTLSYQK